MTGSRHSLRELSFRGRAACGRLPDAIRSFSNLSSLRLRQRPWPRGDAFEWDVREGYCVKWRPPTLLLGRCVQRFMCCELLRTDRSAIDTAGLRHCF